MEVTFDFGHLPAVDQLGDKASLAFVFAVCGATPVRFVAVDTGSTEALALVNQKHAVVNGGEFGANCET